MAASPPCLATTTHPPRSTPMDPRTAAQSSMSPVSGLQPPRNCHRMGMIPGSSTVEHSAVNFNMNR